MFKFIHGGKFLSAGCHSCPSDKPIWHMRRLQMFFTSINWLHVSNPHCIIILSCSALVFILNSIGCDFLLTNVLRMASCIASRWKIRLDKILMRVDLSPTVLCLKCIYMEHSVVLGTQKKIYYFFFSSLCTELRQFANHPFLKLIEYTFVQKSVEILLEWWQLIHFHLRSSRVYYLNKAQGLWFAVQ